MRMRMRMPMPMPILRQAQARAGSEPRPRVRPDPIARCRRHRAAPSGGRPSVGHRHRCRRPPQDLRRSTPQTPLPAPSPRPQQLKRATCGMRWPRTRRPTLHSGPRTSGRPARQTGPSTSRPTGFGLSRVPTPGSPHATRRRSPSPPEAFPEQRRPRARSALKNPGPGRLWRPKPCLPRSPSRPRPPATRCGEPPARGCAWMGWGSGLSWAHTP